MAIRFDQLPSERPAGFALPDKGQYKAKIEKAEMKQPQDAKKPMYLNLTLALTDADGNAKGKVFDIISESESDYVRYKLKRFIMALGVPLTGSIELKDLSKIAQGKDMLVDITIDEKQDPARAVVDIFSNEIFYPLDAPTASTTIDASDAADAEDTPFGVDHPTETTY